MPIVARNLSMNDELDLEELDFIPQKRGMGAKRSDRKNTELFKTVFEKNEAELPFVKGNYKKELAKFLNEEEVK
jgi:hypothetical protein